MTNNTTRATAIAVRAFKRRNFNVTRNDIIITTVETMCSGTVETVVKICGKVTLDKNLAFEYFPRIEKLTLKDSLFNLLK